MPGIHVNIRSSPVIQVLQEKCTTGPFGASPGDPASLPISTYAPNALVMTVSIEDKYLDSEPSTANLSHMRVNAAFVTLAARRPAELRSR